MKETIRWDFAGRLEREAVCELIGWRTRKGTVDRTGKRIASTDWDKLSEAARNVLSRHGIIK